MPTKITTKLLVMLLLAAASIILANQLNRLVSLSHVSSGKNMDEIPQYISGGGNASMLLSSTTNTTTTSKWEPLPWSLPRSQLLQQSSEDFMTELNQLKRSLNISLPWDTTTNFSLPTPIINLNLPKSGTLTLSEFFKCGGFNSAHTWAPSTPSVRIGDCMRDNFLSNKAPFQRCDIDHKTQEKVRFYSDVGIPEPHCFYSSLHDGGLDHIAKYYPNATILMMHRDFDAWHASIQKWGNGRLLGRWKKKCGITGSIGTCAKNDVPCWKDFYNAHTEKIREFARKHLSMTYVELSLDESTPVVLESYTGVSASCFQHCRPGRPTDPTIDLTKYKKCQPNATTTIQLHL